jgi:hypothetical protein
MISSHTVPGCRAVLDQIDDMDSRGVCFLDFVHPKGIELIFEGDQLHPSGCFLRREPMMKAADLSHSLDRTVASA